MVFNATFTNISVI